MFSAQFIRLPFCWALPRPVKDDSCQLGSPMARPPSISHGCCEQPHALPAKTGSPTAPQDLHNSTKAHQLEVVNADSHSQLHVPGAILTGPPAPPFESNGSADSTLSTSGAISSSSSPPPGACSPLLGLQHSTGSSRRSTSTSPQVSLHDELGEVFLLMAADQDEARQAREGAILQRVPTPQPHPKPVGRGLLSRAWSASRLFRSASRASLRSQGSGTSSTSTSRERSVRRRLTHGTTTVALILAGRYPSSSPSQASSSSPSTGVALSAVSLLSSAMSRSASGRANVPAVPVGLDLAGPGALVGDLLGCQVASAFGKAFQSALAAGDASWASKAEVAGLFDEGAKMLGLDRQLYTGRAVSRTSTPLKQPTHATPYQQLSQ